MKEKEEKTKQKTFRRRKKSI